MNTTIGTFMKVAATVIVIGGLVLGVAITMITSEAGTYRTSITAVEPPSTPTLP